MSTESNLTTWSFRRVDELFEIYSGITVNPGRAPSRNSRGYLRVANVQRGRIDLTDVMEVEEFPGDAQRYALMEGDLLIVEGHANPGEIGRCAVVGTDAQGLLHQNHVYRLRGEQIIPRLAVELLNSQKVQQYWLSRTATSSGLYTINRRMLAALKLPHIPRPEQDQIVDVLDSFTAAQWSAEEAIAKVRVVKSAVWEACSSGARWPSRRITELVQLPTGQVDPRIDPYLRQQLLAPDHVEPKTGRLTIRKTSEEQAAVSGKYVVRAGDVVLSKIRPALRKVVVADFEGVCSADMYPLRPASGILPDYLAAELLGDRFAKFSESVSGRTGIPKLNRGDLASYFLPVPPVGEQRRVVELMSALGEKESCEVSRFRKILSIKEGFIRALINGKLRLDGWKRLASSL